MRIHPILRSVLILSFVALADAPLSGQEASVGEAVHKETVVLLHGLGRSSFSMLRLERSLEKEGYNVLNLGYPSRTAPIPELADSLGRALELLPEEEKTTVHFVTHSLGGIIVRYHLGNKPMAQVGRVVMLSPPNQGSEIADRLPAELLELVLGPTALQLGTDSVGVLHQLPSPTFEVGIITGDVSLNFLFSHWLPGKDDGMVSVESARIEGVEDFIVVPYSHTFIMYKGDVIREVAHYLRTGVFSSKG